MENYVHGYSERKRPRLRDQAATLARLLYGDIQYPAGATVLEAGCGAGCQTVFLAAAHPEACFVSMDIAETSLHAAQLAIAAHGLGNVRLQQGDIVEPPFPTAPLTTSLSASFWNTWPTRPGPCGGSGGCSSRGARSR